MVFEISFGGQTFDPRDLLKDDELDSSGTSWLVQFTAPLTPAQVAALRDQFGLALTDLVPASTFVERIDAEVAGRLARHPLVRAVAPYGPDLKLSPTFDAVQRRTTDDDEAVAADAVLFDDVDLEATVTELGRLGAVGVRGFDDRTSGGTAFVRFGVRDLGLLRQVARIGGVRWVQPVLEMTDDAPDPGTGTATDTPPQPAIASFGPVWDRGVHGEGQVIAVMDAGPFDIDHCFFEDTPNTPGPTHRKVVELRNQLGSDAGPHATFVAGCAAGDQAAAPGRHPRRGGAWAARLVGSNRRDLREHSTLRRELEAHVAAGATIHSNSWHFLPPAGSAPGAPLPYDANCAAVDAFLWAHEEHLVVCSAGNTGESQGPPGTAKNVLCVAASRQDAVALGDGSPGPTHDGRRRPEIMMIGCGVISADVDSGCGVAPRNPCASSYATPYAAAAAALVRQYLLEGRHPTGAPSATGFTPTGALLKAVLLNATVPPSAPSDHPSDSMGWGLVDIASVLAGGRRAMSLWDVRHADGLATGGTAAYPVTVADGVEPLRVSLVWTDPPGTVGADDPVVNDLDLDVTSPDGTTFRGNAFSDGVSQPNADRADARNNAEMVVVENPEPGVWTLTVRARTMTTGAQPGQGFALVASGRLHVTE